MSVSKQMHPRPSSRRRGVGEDGDVVMIGHGEVNPENVKSDYCL